MSAISLLSYILIVLIFLLNNIKRLSAYFSLNIYFAVIMGYVATSLYFTDIINHFLFPVMITLLGVSYFQIFLIKKYSSEKSNLYINAGQFLIPLFLVISKTYWEQFVLIVMLEMMRVISDTNYTLKRSQRSFLNFVNVSHRIVLLFIATTMIYILAGNNEMNGAIKHTDVFMIIPITLYLLYAFISWGGANSITVEKINLTYYGSKNLLAYGYIYQFLIPYVLIKNLKLIIWQFDTFLYQESVLCIKILFSINIVINIINYFRGNSLLYRHHIAKNMLIQLLSAYYILTSVVSTVEYLLVGCVLILLFNLKAIGNNYKVKFKKYINQILNIIIFTTPISPLFYFFFFCAENITKNEGLFLKFITILTICFLNLEFYSEKNKEKYKKTDNENRFVNQRLSYLLLFLVFNVVVLSYEKI